MKKRTKSIIAAVLCASMMLAGCSNGNKTPDASPAQTADANRPLPTNEFTITESTGAGNSGDVKLEKGDTYAVISIKEFGDIKVKLYPDLVPYAVYNFVELAKKGTYNGRNFHRIVEDFMIQGGSESGDGAGGRSIDGGEFKNDINTSLRHYYGALCCCSNGLGDLSDGFYIVNSKSHQEELESYYDIVSSSFAYTSEYYGQYVDYIDPSMDDYQKYLRLYTGLRDYNKKAAEGAAAMKKTLTEEVKKTYAEKGGKAQLDGAYTVIGQTVEGFDVIDKITAVEKTTGNDGNESKPVKEIIIDKIEIFTME